MESMRETLLDQNEELYVSRAILANGSLFFRRMFDGEAFKESWEDVIAIHLAVHEKEFFLDLLKYMHTNTLEADTVEKLLGVYHMSQRFLAESCVELCLQKLRSLPLSLQATCSFLESSATMDQTKECKSLKTKCIAFLVDYFKFILDWNGGQSPELWANSKDFERLAAHVVKCLLVSDDLQVFHEESVYHALKTWITVNCKQQQQKTNAWKRFGPLIRWPIIETYRLKALLKEVECGALQDVIVEALYIRHLQMKIRGPWKAPQKVSGADEELAMLYL